MLRHDRALEQLVDVQNEVLVQAVHSPLRETLERICETACTLLQADLAAIYPLQEDTTTLRYDHQQAARTGNRRHSRELRPS
ncbi:MAG: hypothetical protein KatS3mg050_4995 [Litorilinea sp.]|nr:MAG: hypothetical protein KatS3mg050_4995 [Litorilinea sp.]